MSWSYIAGFFDGEGSLVKNGNGFRVSIPQTNQEVLLTIREYTGFGHVVKVTKRREHWKDSWLYYIARQEDVFTFISKITPFLIVKKQIATEILPELGLIVRKLRKQRQRHISIVRAVQKMRAAGLPFRKIGKQLGIDWGYARRITIK